MYTTEALFRVLFARIDGHVIEREWLRMLYLLAHGPEGSNVTRRWLAGRYVYQPSVRAE